MPTSRLSSRSCGLLLAVCGVLTISFDALLVRLAHTDNADVIFWRGVFIFLSLSLVQLIRQRRSPIRAVLDGGAPAAGCSVFYGLGGVLFVSAVMFTDVANAVVIISMSPLFAGLLTWIFGIEAIPLRTWPAIACAISGVVMVFYGSLEAGGMLGNAIALLASLNIGSNLTLLRRNTWLDPLPLVCVGGAIMALLSAPFASPLSLEPQSYLVLALMGLVQMPAALVLIGLSTRYLPSPEVSLFLLVETVCAPIWVWLVLGEEPPGLTFLGGGIILATLVVHFWLGLREVEEPAEPASAQASTALSDQEPTPGEAQVEPQKGFPRRG
jgi:drug/metabolite transporter (DMT)-like permease